VPLILDDCVMPQEDGLEMPWMPVRLQIASAANCESTRQFGQLTTFSGCQIGGRVAANYFRYDSRRPDAHLAI
jgi:hypothetical protein